MALTKAERDWLKNKYGGHCAYCGCVLPDKGWHADHIEPVFREIKWVRGKGAVATGNLRYEQRDDLANMNPACRRCNLYKDRHSVEGLRREISQQIMRLRRDSRPFRLAEDFGLVQATGNEVVFWFEKYNAEQERKAKSGARTITRIPRPR